MSCFNSKLTLVKGRYNLRLFSSKKYFIGILRIALWADIDTLQITSEKSSHKILHRFQMKEDI